MKNALRLAAQLFILVSVVVFDIAFTPTLPWSIGALNLSLTVVIFVALIVNIRLALWWAIVLGILLDLYNATPFGVSTLALLAALMLSDILLERVFTNRSLYTLLFVGSIGFFVFQLVAIGLHSTLGFAGFASYPSSLTTERIRLLGMGLLFHNIVLAALFWVVNYVTRGLRSYFIVDAAES